MELRLNVSIRFLKYALAWETGNASTRLACVRRVNKTPPSNVCQTAPISLFWASKGHHVNNFTANEFRISLQADWQIDDLFFCNKKPIMASGQILVPRRGPQFWRCFADGLNQKFSGLFHAVQRIIIYSLSLSFSFFFQEVRRSKGLRQECHAHPVQDDRRTSGSCKLLLRHV